MTVKKYFTNKAKTKYKWWFVVDVPSGLYDKFGKPIRKQYRKKGFCKKEDAQKAERKFLDNLEGGKVELNGDVLFKDVINYLFDYMKNEGKSAKGTLENYEGSYKNHMQDLKLVPIKRLTTGLIQSWVRNLYKNNGSDHVYNACLKLMKRAFNYAIEMKQITINPFNDFKPVSIPAKLRNRFSTKELKEVIDTCIEAMPEFYCIFCIATLTGMREGEYSALRPCDIKRKENRYVAYVDKQITRNEYKDRTKTENSIRVADISDKVYGIIQWHIKTFNIPFNDFLFRADKGGMLYAKWVERKFEKLLELCGYDEKFCRVHDLRGQYVDIMHLCDVPTEYISRQVGHTNPIVTSKAYTQILNELPIEANQRMDEVIFGKKEDKSDNTEEKHM